MLSFTGNWYIDLGILGMRILFDEARGISDKVNFRLDNRDNFIKSFLVVYLTKVIGEQLRNNLGKKPDREKYEEFLNLLKDKRKKYFKKIFSNRLYSKNIEEVIDSVFKNFQHPLVDEVINRKLPSNEKKNQNETYLQFVKKQRDKKRLWLDSNFYKNFPFFNPSTKIDRQKENIIRFFTRGEEVIDKDRKVVPVEFFKTLNKFLPSYNEFPNNFFVSTSLNDIVSQMNIQDYIFYASILSIPYAFVDIRGVNYAFYSPDGEFSFAVNLRLKKYLEREEEKNDNEILKITWRSIIDVLLEQKSEWALNDMYLISYRRIRNEGVEGVEYIGVDKQKAKIVIDDDFREKLNVSLGGKWLIMEYLRGASLFKLSFEYVKSNLDEAIYREPIFYALAIEANSNKYGKIGRSYSAFDCFSKYNLADNSKIKEAILKIRQANRDFNAASSLDDKSVYYLLIQLKEDKKGLFVNTLLKLINNYSKDSTARKRLTLYILENILYNKNSWRYYGLALISPYGK